MAYRNNFSIKNDRNNRISNLMNRLDQNLLSDLSSINSNYSSNNLLDNYEYQKNYSLTDLTYEENDREEFSNFLSESNEEDDKHHTDLKVLLKLERKRRKGLENRLKQIQASIMKKKQLQDNEKLCKKLSNSLTNTLQNRRFEGDGSEDDEMTNPQTKSNLVLKNKNNYQTSNYQNNSPNKFRTKNSYQSNYQNNDLNDLNQYSTNNLKFKGIDKLIKIIKQEQELNDLNGQMNKNFVNDECSNSLNEFNSRNLMKNIKNNLVNNAAHSSLDNQSSKSLDCTPNPTNNDLFFNEINLKKQIIQSMKSNFNSMIEFIQNQSFSQDNFMAIQQLINLILMQNCQFMNHQQVLLCWLQKLQFQLCTSRSNQTAHFSNNLNSTDATGDSTTVLFTDGQLNDQLNSTNSQQLNNSNLKLASTLNNQQIEPSIKTANNFYDNLKSNSSLYSNQLGAKLKNSVQNFKINNKLNKSTSDKQQPNLKIPNEFKELYSLIEKMIEEKQNATGKVNYHQEFDEPGAVGGEEKIDLDLNENLHNNLKIQQSSTTNGNLGVNNNLNNGNHLSNGISNLNGTNTSNNNNSSSANKSPQMIIHLPSSSSAVRKKTTIRKNPDVIESISCSDDIIKNSTESVRPLMAAEGRSCEFNPATTVLQNQVKTINSSTNPKISSTSSISSNPIGIVVAAASSTNSNTAHVLLKRPPTTGAARRFDQDDDNDDTEETSDDDLANQTSEVLNSSENENNVNSSNLPNSNANSVPFVESSSTIDPEQQIDEGFANALNGRNDSEIRLSGDGEQGL